MEDKDEKGNLIKKIIESQMIGLTQDKEGNLFHWLTDSGKDIAFLISHLRSIH